MDEGIIVVGVPKCVVCKCSCSYEEFDLLVGNYWCSACFKTYFIKVQKGIVDA